MTATTLSTATSNSFRLDLVDQMIAWADTQPRLAVGPVKWSAGSARRTWAGEIEYDPEAWIVDREPGWQIQWWGATSAALCRRVDDDSLWLIRDAAIEIIGGAVPDDWPASRHRPSHLFRWDNTVADLRRIREALVGSVGEGHLVA